MVQARDEDQGVGTERKGWNYKLWGEKAVRTCDLLMEVREGAVTTVPELDQVSGR